MDKAVQSILELATELDGLTHKKAEQRIEQMLMKYEILRSHNIAPKQALIQAVKEPSRKKSKLEREFRELEEKRSKRQRIGKATAKLLKYSGEIKAWHKEGLGAYRIADLLWKLHRAKVSPRTINRFLNQITMSDA